MKRIFFTTIVAINVLIGAHVAGAATVNGHTWVMTPEAVGATATFDTFSATIVAPTQGSDRPFDVLITSFGPAGLTWADEGVGWIDTPQMGGCHADVWRKPQSAKRDPGTFWITAVRNCDYTAPKAQLYPTPVPLPAAAWMLIAALGWLGGLGVMRARS